MRVFLINLDKDTDRLAAADAQLKGQGVDYERFPAVYAKALPQAELDKAVNTFRWWCCVGRPVIAGEIGCALSHYTLYRKMIDEGIAYACILEDDVVMDESFRQTLDSVERWLDSGKPQVVLLSNNLNLPEYGEDICERSAGLFTESYVITMPAARALLKENMPLRTPCDHWGRWVSHGAIRLYAATPAPCRQNWTDYESNMAEGNPLIVRDLPLLPRLAHKAKRLVGVTIDRLLCLMGR